MKRRDFLAHTAIATVGLSIIGNSELLAQPQSKVTKKMLLTGGG